MKGDDASMIIARIGFDRYCWNACAKCLSEICLISCVLIGEPVGNAGDDDMSSSVNRMCQDENERLTTGFSYFHPRGCGHLSPA